MELTKDYNFFYSKNKDMSTKILITSALGKGKYSIEDIKDIKEKMSKKESKKIEIYQDDGENFWEIFSGEKLEIGNKKNNYVTWNEVKDSYIPIEIEDLMVLMNVKEKKKKISKSLL